MVHETIDGTYRQTNLSNESAEYLVLRHFYSVHPRLDHDIKERGIDEYNPIWNILDLTPQGRGTFYASLDYGTKVQAARR